MSDDEFRTLLEGHRAFVQNFACKIKSSIPDDALCGIEDFTQDVIVRAWKRRHHYDPAKSKITSFLVMTLYNELYDRIGNVRRRIRTNPNSDESEIRMLNEPARSNATEEVMGLLSVLDDADISDRDMQFIHDHCVNEFSCVE